MNAAIELAKAQNRIVTLEAQHDEMRHTIDLLLNAAGYPKWSGEPSEGPPDPDKWIANMRSQHAEMLAALKASVDLADSNVMHDPTLGILRTDECKAVYDQCIAAIMHAEGES